MLTALSSLAPLTAVRGNCDVEVSCVRLPSEAVVSLGELPALVVHQLGGPERPSPEVRRAYLGE